jgi:hypothetical protein
VGQAAAQTHQLPSGKSTPKKPRFPREKHDIDFFETRKHLKKQVGILWKKSENLENA